METKILRIEGNFEVIGFFMNGVLIRTTKRRVYSWN